MKLFFEKKIKYVVTELYKTALRVIPTTHSNPKIGVSIILEIKGVNTSLGTLWLFKHGLVMDFAMMKLTMKVAILIMAIAVEIMFRLTTA